MCVGGGEECGVCVCVCLFDCVKNEPGFRQTRVRLHGVLKGPRKVGGDSGEVCVCLCVFVGGIVRRCVWLLFVLKKVLTD